MTAMGLAAVALTTVVPVGPVAAAPGDTAPGFGTNGVVVAELGTGNAPDEPSGVVRFADGSIMMVASSSNSVTNGSIDMVRLRPDGRPDTTFGPRGRRSIVVKPVSRVTAVARQGDRLIVAGLMADALGGDSDLFVGRINANGTFDTSFSGNGWATVDVEATDEGMVVAPGPGGSVLVAGRADQQAVVVRLTAAGELDADFGIGGMRRLTTGYAIGQGSLIDLDMHATASGAVTLVFSDVNATRVVRLTPAGALDGTFDNDGDRSIDLLPGPESNQRVARSGDRTYLVIGKSGSLWVIALGTDGANDDAFSGDGVELLAIDDPDVDATDAIVDSSGNLVISGVGTAVDGTDWVVARVRPTGGLDPAFAGDGVVVRRFDGEAGAAGVITRPAGYIVLGLRRTDLTALAIGNDGTPLSGFGTNGVRSVDTTRRAHGFEPASVDRAPGGRLLVTGSLKTGRRGLTQRFALLRYRGTGVLDTTFGGDGVVTADIAGRRDSFVGAQQLANGKVLAWGWSLGVDSTSVVIMRFTATGAPDTSFGTNGRRTFTADDVYNRQLPVLAVVDAQGRIVLAHLYNAGGMAGIMVRRLRADGSDDPSFGTAGRRLLPTAIAESPNHILIRKGRLLVLHMRGLRIVRLTADGDLDATFGAGGERALDLPNEFLGSQGVIMRNGRIVAVRNVGTTAAEVVRQRPDGTDDLSFSDDGLLVIPDFGEDLSQTDRLTVGADGTIVVGGVALTGLSSTGYGQARSTLTRITPSGELDTTFGGDGRATRQVYPGGFEFPVDTMIAADGDPVMLVATVDDGFAARLWRVQG